MFSLESSFMSSAAWFSGAGVGAALAAAGAAAGAMATTTGGGGAALHPYVQVPRSIIRAIRRMPEDQPVSRPPSSVTLHGAHALFNRGAPRASEGASRRPCA